MSTTIIPIWVKVVGAGTESTTFVDCNPTTTNIARIKKLVKVECSPDLDHIAAYRLIIKGDDKKTIEEDVYVSEREDGRTKARAFIVEVPAVEGSTHLYLFRYAFALLTLFFNEHINVLLIC